MHWVAPSEKDAATDALGRRLWDATEQLRANSGLNAAQYSTPVLSHIFLRFADVRFEKIREGLEKMASSSRRVDEPATVQAELGRVDIGEVRSPLLQFHSRNDWAHLLIPCERQPLCSGSKAKTSAALATCYFRSCFPDK